MYKTKDMENIAKQIKKNYQISLDTTYLDKLAYEKNSCIEIDIGTTSIYSTDSFNRGCITEGNHPIQILEYKNDFTTNRKEVERYKIINPRFQNKTLVYAIRLGNNTYAYINASLEPIDSTITILKNQLIIVSIGVFLLSFLIAYFISKKISNPMIHLNNAVRQMGKGDYNIHFETNTDIAELNELGKTLNKAKEELSKTEELRRELLANVSHDLNTPLTMIKAYAEMVRDYSYKNKKKRNDNLNVIIEETDRLNHLVNDILDLSCMQSKTMQLNIEEFDLISMIQNILKRYDILKEEGYQLCFQNNSKIMIHADYKKLEQVVYNLINNAIEYTGKDLKVIIQVTETEEKVSVAIIDTGKGIHDLDLPHIWDKYYKVDKNHQRQVKGTGLGLSIVKNILELHHYPYGVITKKGHGTNFYFEIPKQGKDMVK